jgi:exopolyphosphatase/guanosine-5'-triphosphate,3'-diphosphate pyrophosphatase
MREIFYIFIIQNIHNESFPVFEVIWMLFGIVDIGSNTVKLNVYRCENRVVKVLFSKKENLGLVFYIKEGKLTNKGIGKLVTVLKEMKKNLDSLKIENYSFFATAALRNIENRADVIEIINEEVEIEIDVLSGEEEGELSFCGSVSTLKKDNGILIDVGGGSIEIVLFKSKKIKKAYSIPVGSLKMYNDYVSLMLPNKKESNLIKERIYSELEKAGVSNEKIPFICGIGGGLRAIGKLLVDLNLQQEKADLIDVELLKQLENELKHNNKDTYNRILHVKPSKIHTLVPALLILESINSYFGCEEIQISKFSVREGYLYKKLLNRAC